MDKWISKAAAGVLAAGLMAVAAQEAAAQKQRGDIFLLPQAGVNVSRLSGYDVLIGNTKQAATMESSSKAGLTAGLEAEYMVTGRLGARLGLLYSEQGDRVKNVPEADIKTRLKYLSIPLTAHFYVTDWLGVHAGVQYSRLIDDNCMSGADIGVTPDLYSAEDWSIPVGASVEYCNVVLSASYVFGLSKVCPPLGSTRNRSLWITLGYRVKL